MKYLSIKKILGLGIILTIGALLLSPGFLNKNIVKGQSSCHTEIHIGEVVDETEEYGYKLLKEYTDLYDNAVLAKDAGLAAANNAASMITNITGMPSSEMNDADTLLSLTDITLGNCKDCPGACVPGTCTCTKYWHNSVSEFAIGGYDYCELTGGCLLWGPWPPCVCPPHCIVCPPRPCIDHEYRCAYCGLPCNCSTCVGSPCPMLQINNTVTSLTNYYNSANTNYTNINTVWSNIKNTYNPKITTANANIIGLTVLPITHIPTPAQISAKLDVARGELRTCFTPFECTEQLIAGSETCTVGGEIFALQFLYTCPLIDQILQESYPRCNEEAADHNKANNFFCCESW